jgi:hypothetical protein
MSADLAPDRAGKPPRTMTPNDRLKPVDRNALLSSILKFFLPGNWRMIRSTHIIDAAHSQTRYSIKLL